MMNLRVCVSVVAGVVGLSQAQPLVSVFSLSTEGWTIETRTNPDGAFSFVANYAPDFVVSGGDTGGYLSEVDPDAQWSFFKAPTAWLGDRSSASGRVLRYSTRTDAVSYPDGRLVVMFGNNGQRLSHDAGIPVVNTWTRRVVPLREGAWSLGTNGSGTPATRAQIDAVLADLEALYIGMEFGGELAEERVDLDRVALGVCDADLAEPFGIHDLADITAFVSAFTGMDPAADFNGDGLFDLRDITAFVSGFTGGCQ